MQVAVSRLADVRTDAELKETLRSMMRGGDGSTRALRTFIAEMEGPDPVSRAPEVQWESRPTGIDGVTVMASRYVDVDLSGRLIWIDRRDVKEWEIYLDRRDGKFCLLHMDMTDEEACRAVELLARTTNLRRAWVFPHSVSEYAAQCGGSVAAGSNGGHSGSALIRRNDPYNGGHADAMAAYYGIISTRGGTSIDAHLGVARDIRAIYSKTLVQVEKYCVGQVEEPGNRHIAIDPLICSLSKRIDDIPGFIDRVLDGKGPLRIHGGKIKVEDDNYHVPMADLEGGVPLDAMISPQALRVHTPIGWSGSAALRLMAYIQYHHDAGLVCHQVTLGGSGV